MKIASTITCSRNDVMLVHTTKKSLQCPRPFPSQRVGSGYETSKIFITLWKYIQLYNDMVVVINCENEGKDTPTSPIWKFNSRCSETELPNSGMGTRIPTLNCPLHPTRISSTTLIPVIKNGIKHITILYSSLLRNGIALCVAICCKFTTKW